MIVIINWSSLLWQQYCHRRHNHRIIFSQAFFIIIKDFLIQHLSLYDAMMFRHKTEFLRGLQHDHQVLCLMITAMMIMTHILMMRGMIWTIDNWWWLWRLGGAGRWIWIKQGHLSVLQVLNISNPNNSFSFHVKAAARTKFASRSCCCCFHNHQ